MAQKIKVALPDELDAVQRQELVADLVQYLVQVFGYSADWPIRVPRAKATIATIMLVFRS